MTTWHHEERLQAVQAALRAHAPRSVVDLGCGAGDLFVRLAQESGIERLTGLDLCPDALARLRARLDRLTPKVPRIALHEASVLQPPPGLAPHDCALLVEVIEHLPPERLSLLERALFAGLRPETVIVTTPNAEFNALLGVPPQRFRHPGHRFEWSRARFRRWCGRAAGAAGYEVACSDIAGCHPSLGGASQMAVFTRAA